MVARRKAQAENYQPESTKLSTTLTRTVYEELRQILEESTGIELGENKYSLVESRLLKRLNTLQLSSFSKYLKLIMESDEEFKIFINCMTTNKTDWFREPRHFSYLAESAIPILINEKKKGSDQTIYIWSAASSTGEEIYSLAMTFEEHLSQSADYRILGTDIDTDVLQKAASAAYKKTIVEEQVPVHLRMKYFTNSAKDEVSVCRQLRERTKFRQFNLIESQMPVEMQFDIIFLRNVLIYFTRTTIENVIRRLLRNLKPGGLIFIGHSESLNGLSLPIDQVSEAVYRHKR